MLRCPRELLRRLLIFCGLGVTLWLGTLAWTSARLDALEHLVWHEKHPLQLRDSRTLLHTVAASRLFPSRWEIHAWGLLGDLAHAEKYFDLAMDYYGRSLGQTPLPSTIQVPPVSPPSAPEPPAMLATNPVFQTLDSPQSFTLLKKIGTPQANPASIRQHLQVHRHALAALLHLSLTPWPAEKITLSDLPLISEGTSLLALEAIHQQASGHPDAAGLHLHASYRFIERLEEQPNLVRFILALNLRQTLLIGLNAEGITSLRAVLARHLAPADLYQRAIDGESQSTQTIFQQSLLGDDPITTALRERIRQKQTAYWQAVSEAPFSITPGPSLSEQISTYFFTHRQSWLEDPAELRAAVIEFTSEVLHHTATPNIGPLANEFETLRRAEAAWVQ